MEDEPFFGTVPLQGGLFDALAEIGVHAEGQSFGLLWLHSGRLRKRRYPDQGRARQTLSDIGGANELVEDVSWPVRFQNLSNKIEGVFKLRAAEVCLKRFSPRCFLSVPSRRTRAACARPGPRSASAHTRRSSTSPLPRRAGAHPPAGGEACSRSLSRCRLLNSLPYLPDTYFILRRMQTYFAGVFARDFA